ncbi:MAG: hypothetical protein ACO3JL_21805, partial [Myxococcota bacterium]
QDAFGALKTQVSWTYFAGGTGVMTEALQEGELDIALMLTEGFVSAFHRGLDAKIVKVYTATPLTWGIYSGRADTPVVDGPHDRRYAISKRGSGSHLMARIHAAQLGFHPRDEQYVEVSNLANAMESLKAGRTHYFYWEKYTTLPHVKRGRLSFLGTFHAPWCGFVTVANRRSLEERGDIIRTVMSLMNDRCNAFLANRENIFRVSNRFEIATAAAEEWFDSTRYQTDFTIRRSELEAVHQGLGLSGSEGFDAMLDLPHMTLVP